MDTQRQIRYSELIRSLLSDCLLKEDFFDENINSTSITISFVRMSKDLKKKYLRLSQVLSVV